MRVKQTVLLLNTLIEMKDLKMHQYKRTSTELGGGKTIIKVFIVLRSSVSILMSWLYF